ncbi:hypothetical protein MIZ01_1582 [Sideroxyarcus emersonii]|uniref:Uncharacterized protein n=1 Tax=Sideroxyarcus emersonii TaxID=2764705 RepID=A0AAN2BZ74_9PROT|nr:hypothetical protein [Sideroxyarcus emersonii]BCK87786.1 hypothetical protein MIZ01_1582 [Sideroxyarcus emersonii]
MNQIIRSSVIHFAQEVHKKHWRMTGDAGTGDKLAAIITADWQSAVEAAFPGRFVREHPVGQLRERIDLVDIIDGIAYELKVSPNNDHFEFYRDIFKVLVARDNGLPKLRSFCFVCPLEAAQRYKKGLRKAVLGEGERLGLDLSVESL